MVIDKNGCFCRKTNKIYINIMFKHKLISFITNPTVRNTRVGLPETTILHSGIIRENLYLKKIYEEWYSTILNFLHRDTTGSILELGSGGGFLKHYLPELITSDIITIPNIDIIFDGQALPFKKESMKGIVMTNVLHHLYNVDIFLKEAAFTVKPGGVIVMIEPWVTPWARLIYKYLHYEPYDQMTTSWELPEGEPGLRANLALPWIVFKRDRKRLEQKHPEWEITRIIPQMPFRYIISGGVTYKSMLPGSLFKISRKMENILQPFMNYIAMFSTIVLRKKEV